MDDPAAKPTALNSPWRYRVQEATEFERIGTNEGIKSIEVPGPENTRESKKRRRRKKGRASDEWMERKEKKDGEREDIKKLRFEKERKIGENEKKKRHTPISFRLCFRRERTTPTSSHPLRLAVLVLMLELVSVHRGRLFEVPTQRKNGRRKKQDQNLQKIRKKEARLTGHPRA